MDIECGNNGICVPASQPLHDVVSVGAVPAIAAVKERLQGAADTLKRLPSEACRPSVDMTAWPSFVHSVHEAYGYGSVRQRLPAPAPAAIDEMEQIFALTVERLDDDERFVVWACAFGVSWRKITRRLGGCHRQTAWRRWMVALGKLVEK